ncbi:MAG: hypothetical protein KatS3mg009_2228 [Acidimicrobiia bacterium]|nr:MAG: hypothetical protein KatS3mg009_2228 [Acidimicrobiia bacterium]
MRRPRRSRSRSAPARACAALAVAIALTGLTPEPAPAAPTFHGSLGGMRLNAPVTTIVATATGRGYHVFARDGGVFAFGDAVFRGSLGGIPLNGPIVDGARTASGRGYYMVGGDGGVFAFGDAVFRGSLGGLRLAAPIVAIEATADGRGYVMLGADGGVFAFGGARWSGSLAGRTGGVPATGLALRPQGDGYWIVLRDGRTFAFGAAPAVGEPGPLDSPVVAAEPAPDGRGLLLVTAAGGAYALGSARFHGSIAGATLQAPVVDVALTPSGDGYWMLGGDGGVFTFPGPGLPPGGVPTLTVTPVVTGRDIPWDVGFLPGGVMVFTERAGRIHALVGGSVRTLAAPGDVRPGGEGGMLGLAVDPAFAGNRRIYTCHNTTGGDIEVVAWVVDAAVTSAVPVRTLVDGIPQSATGRHSGCRPRVGPDGHLWVGTGDAATGTHPQDVHSLGGKVLRVDRFTGAAAPGNPFGLRWYTRGHRNVQGLAFRPGSGTPYSVEHGPDRDDEVNRLVAGGNYGWDPVPGYDESVPMTRPGDRPAVWSSGAPTIATAGATFLSGPQWRDWNGALAVAALKGSQLRIMVLDVGGDAVVAQWVRLTGYGRLRSVVQGPDGSLYVTTSNGGGRDQILRVSPS